MKESAQYLKWLAILCAGMAVFCICVFAVGYKELSFGRVATTVALVVASGAFGLLSRKKANR